MATHARVGARSIEARGSAAGLRRTAILRACLLACLFACLLALTGCATSTGGHGEPLVHDATAGVERLGRRDRMITAEELRRSSPGMSLEDAVRTLRPVFMMGRGGPPTVYIDGVRYGSIETLRLVEAGSVRLIELLDASAAMRRYGIMHAAPIIEVTTLARD